MSELTQFKEPDPRPFKIHRDRRGWPRWYQRWLEAWWIITNQWSLHKAWQAGHDHGTRWEYNRIIVNMGDIRSQRHNVAKADDNIRKLSRETLP